MHDLSAPWVQPTGVQCCAISALINKGSQCKQIMDVLSVDTLYHHHHHHHLLCPPLWLRLHPQVLFLFQPTSNFTISVFLNRSQPLYLFFQPRSRSLCKGKTYWLSWGSKDLEFHSESRQINPQNDLFSVSVLASAIQLTHSMFVEFSSRGWKSKSFYWTAVISVE